MTSGTASFPEPGGRASLAVEAPEPKTAGRRGRSRQAPPRTRGGRGLVDPPQLALRLCGDPPCTRGAWPRAHPPPSAIRGGARWSGQGQGRGTWEVRDRVTSGRIGNPPALTTWIDAPQAHLRSVRAFSGALRVPGNASGGGARPGPAPQGASSTIRHPVVRHLAARHLAARHLAARHLAASIQGVGATPLSSRAPVASFDEPVQRAGGGTKGHGAERRRGPVGRSPTKEALHQARSATRCPECKPTASSRLARCPVSSEPKGDVLGLPTPPIGGSGSPRGCHPLEVVGTRTHA